MTDMVTLSPETLDALGQKDPTNADGAIVSTETANALAMVSLAVSLRKIALTVVGLYDIAMAEKAKDEARGR